MGVVVTVAMLLGLFVLTPFIKNVFRPYQIIYIGHFLLLAGLWNTLWFGLRHLEVFWGYAAIVSGLAMMMSAVLILKKYERLLLFPANVLDATYTALKPFAFIVITALVASFGLYAITLIRLNLGLSIIH